MSRSQSSEDGYRLCAGVALINAEGLVFIGRRMRGHGGTAPGFEWQMPQGGIEKYESPLAAARRELYEETSVLSLEVVAEGPEWLSYDLPAEAAGRFGGRYKGQRQRWFLFRFKGLESEIDIDYPAGGRHKAEFSDWRWERWDALPDLVIPFKREIYVQVRDWFAPLSIPQSRTI